MSSIETTYTHLVGALKRLDTLSSVNGLLGWDEQVNLPAGSADIRGEQSALMAEIIHTEATKPEIGEWIETLRAGQDTLTADQLAVLRDAERDYRHATRLPKAFVTRRTKAHSAGYHAWTKARADDDFKGFAAYLETNLELAREEAALMEAPHAYNFWLDQFDPGLDQATVESLFNPLKVELKELVGQIEASGKSVSTDALKGFPVDQQATFLDAVVKAFGFNFSRGRIDQSVHPFCGGHPLDVRMTTRFHPDNPLDSLSSVMHETGHAMYEQGLLTEHLGTALGEAVGMAVHESQSRMWENQVGRSRAFWQAWEGDYRKLFSAQLAEVSSEDFYRMINKVAISPIRVDADEVTYNLHIMLRFHLETQLFDGSLAIKDLPEAWNAASSEIVGYTPKNNREGCLQDVHWSGGAFGYFPSYCIGNLISAQLWESIEADIPDLEAQFAHKNYAPLLDWLRTHVHHLGRRYLTAEFVEKATGRPLSHAPLVAYLKGRYGPLYGLN
jgi:carboxypeptidase Taq